jgi:hypothetical protein
VNGRGKALVWLGLVVGVVGLVVQFVISIGAYLAAGRDVPGALGAFFIYYTILTNIALVLVYVSELTEWRWLELFRKLDVTGMMVANMLLVMSFVHFFLRGLTQLNGLFLACDIALHYVTPIIYIVWWLVGVRHGPLVARRVPVMLAPTFIYFLIAMARGAWTHEYPYPILNVVKLGYGHVLLNAVAMTLALGCLMLVVIGVDEVLGRLAARRRVARA